MKESVRKKLLAISDDPALYLNTPEVPPSKHDEIRMLPSLYHGTEQIALMPTPWRSEGFMHRHEDSAAEWVSAMDQLGVTPSLMPGDANIMYAHRRAADADYFFLYNQEKYYSEETWWLPLADIDERVSLRCVKPGRKPYVLNLWSGEITTVTDYTEEDGYIQLPLKLKGNDTAAIVLAEEGWNRGAKMPDAAELVDTVFLENWSLTVYSHEPGDRALSGEDLTDTKIVPIEVGEIGMVKPWTEIVGLENISGVGIYRTEMYWDAGERLKAELDLGAVCDLLRLRVNGAEVPGANPVNPVQDITGYLKSGTNVIQVEVASNFFHAEHSRNYLNCNYVERKPYTAWEFGILGQPRLILSRRTADQ